MIKTCIFFLGGARSGKSRLAQELAAKLGNNALFVATAEALDEEMQARIDHHRKGRPRSWRTLEITTGIGRKIEDKLGDADVVIVDCISLLLSNVLGEEPDFAKAEERVLAEIDELIACIGKVKASFIIVSNEVGMGLVPENKLGRTYRDLLGKANQSIAQYADEVYFTISGIPLKIKGH